jgi:hypothetical protein
MCSNSDVVGTRRSLADLLESIKKQPIGRVEVGQTLGIAAAIRGE